MAPASCAGSSPRLRPAPPLRRDPGSIPADLGLGTDTAHRRLGIGQDVLLFRLHTMKNHYH